MYVIWEYIINFLKFILVWKVSFSTKKMNQNSIKFVGICEVIRKDANSSYLNHAEGLKDILNGEFGRIWRMV